MKVITADTGKEATSFFNRTPGVAIVLMDIMMPEMDGYQTMQAIRRTRALQRFRPDGEGDEGDREKCFEAGACD